jgi:hypothetical protein
MNPSWPSCTTMPDNFRSLRKYLGSRSSDIPRAKSAKLAKMQNLFCFLCGLCVLCARYSEIWLRLCRAVRSVVRAYFLVDSTTYDRDAGAGRHRPLPFPRLGYCANNKLISQQCSPRADGQIMQLVKWRKYRLIRYWKY